MTELKEPEQIVETNDTKPILEVMDSSAIEAIQRAEIDVAIATARRFRRDVGASIKLCKELATRNPEVAAKMHYALPRGNKQLVGPSVHFARIVKYAWGHINAGSQVIGCDRENARVLGVCHDLQNNVREAKIMDWPVQPPHVQTPQRWKDQMNLAKRAGTAVAERVAIFEVIPLVLFEETLAAAKLLAVGKGKSFVESREAAIVQCKAMKITQPMIYRTLGVSGLESIDTDMLIWLHAALESIREGTASVVELFGEVTEKAKTPSKGKGSIERPKEPEKAKEFSDEVKRKLSGGSEPQKEEKGDDLLFSDSETGAEIHRSMAESLEQYITAAEIDKRKFFEFLNARGHKHVRDEKLALMTYVDLKPSDLGNAVEHWEATLDAFNQWAEERKDAGPF